MGILVTDVLGRSGLVCLIFAKGQKSQTLNDSEHEVVMFVVSYCMCTSLTLVLYVLWLKGTGFKNP